MLLRKDNVNQDALMSYAREAADVSTNHQLPELEYAHNHYGQPDVAMFDFTSIYAAEHACRVVDRHGHKLLMALVGDSLLEVSCLLFSHLIIGREHFFCVFDCRKDWYDIVTGQFS